MSYQVLARKWRPQSFGTMVGQQHVIRALVNALDNDRLHHAYLFTGTRGVGKTTLARLMAKSLNCEQGVSSSPCGQCSSCREIEEGRFVDLIEVDAASRTRIDETRELLDNVQYAPTRARYKVYLIDEVHMFSRHSFNALLKTLEEPPPHVKFLLATTDPQKLPVTILSRCLQFNLKRLPQEAIRQQLSHILEAEEIGFEPPALERIGRAADGSMRDALSLLDQAIAYGGGTLTHADVSAMLGTIDRQYVDQLLDALVAGDAVTVMECIHNMAEQAPDFAGVLDELISMLQRIAVAQVVPEAMDEASEEQESLRRHAASLPAEDVQLYYQVALMGRRDLALSPDPVGGFEMILLRMLVFRPGSAPAVAPTGSATAAAQEETGDSEAPIAAGVSPPTAARSGDNVSGNAGSWADIVAAMQLGGLEHQLAANCVLGQQTGDRFELILEFAHRNLLTRKLEKRLEEAMQNHLGRTVRLSIVIGEAEGESPAQLQTRLDKERRMDAEKAIRNDELVNALCETFDGQVEPDSIQPTD